MRLRPLNRVPSDTLRFLVEFVQADLLAGTNNRKYSRWFFELLNQSGNTFLVPPPSGVFRGLAKIQADAKEVLTAVLKQQYTANLPLVFTVIRQPKNRVLTVVDGETRVRFIYRVISILEQTGVGRILKCKAPAPRSKGRCGRLFVRVTQKKYCSRRCQFRRYSRRKRADARGERRRLERAALRRRRK